MEIQFLHETFTEKDPKLLIDHIQRMVSGEAPFFPVTLSLVYDRLAEQTFPKNIFPGSGLSGLTKSQNVTTSTPPVRTSLFTSGVTSNTSPGSGLFGPTKSQNVTVSTPIFDNTSSTSPSSGP